MSLALAWVTDFTGLVIARFALGTAEGNDIHISQLLFYIILPPSFPYCIYRHPSSSSPIIHKKQKKHDRTKLISCTRHNFLFYVAGFVPGVLFYLTLFYKRSEHSFRIAIFLCFNILAGAFGGLLAAGISQLAGKWNLQGWQWIFILEAIPTLLLAVLTWFIMTPSPMQAKFLTKEEQIYATNRIIIDSDVIPTASASWRQTRSALTDVRVYLICLGSMFLHLPGSGVVLFLPSLIADMGFKA